MEVLYPGGKPGYMNSPSEGLRWKLNPGEITYVTDWDPNPASGNGLHLWAWASGILGCSGLEHLPHMLWVAAEYERKSAVHLLECIKVPKAKTIAVSTDRVEIAAFIRKHDPLGRKRPTFFVTDVVGDEETTAVGAYGSAYAGYGGTALAAGCYTKATAGDEGYARVERNGTAVVGSYGEAWAGDESTALVAGYGGLASAGKCGFAQAGYGGAASAGKGGVICIQGKAGVIEIAVGTSGVVADTFYVLGDDGRPKVFDHPTNNKRL